MNGKTTITVNRWEMPDLWPISGSVKELQQRSIKQQTVPYGREKTEARWTKLKNSILCSIYYFKKAWKKPDIKFWRRRIISESSIFGQTCMLLRDFYGNVNDCEQTGVTSTLPGGMNEQQILFLKFDSIFTYNRS